MHNTDYDAIAEAQSRPVEDVNAVTEGWDIGTVAFALENGLLTVMI